MRRITSDVYAVGAIDFDARVFDRLIPLPDGTSYNAYLIKSDGKTTLVETVDPAKTDVLFNNLDKLNVESIDYVISHHGEQDHSGSLPAVLARYPSATVVTNARCKTVLMDLLSLDESRFVVLADDAEMSLGDKTMRCIYLPWMHWPETWGTYLVEDRILFSCDMFGAHLADSRLFVTDEAVAYECAKRYYAEIMMPFRRQVNSNLARLADLPIDIIAPSHGPVHRRPEFILDAYRDWASDAVKNEVVLCYVSMHDSTARMVSYLVEALIERGIGVRQFELSTVDVGKYAMSLVDAATIVFGVPTVLAGPHPSAAYAAFLANALRPKARFASIIGSYGWGGRTVEVLTGMISNLKVDMMDPVMVKGHPKDETFVALDALADQILARHTEIGIVN